MLRLFLAVFASAAFGLAALAHDPYDWNGTRYRTVIGDEESEGRIALFVATVDGPGGPPLHRHDGIDEVVYVLSGEIRTVIDGVEAVYGPGEAVFVPRGVEHTYTVTTPAGASLLAILTPGGFEDFFAEASAGRLEIPRDMDRLIALAARYRLEFTGPPLPLE